MSDLAGNPANWEVRNDEEGDQYYYNKKLDLSQWELPACLVPKSAPPTPAPPGLSTSQDAELDLYIEEQTGQSQAPHRHVQGKKSVWVYFWHRHPITQLLWAEQIKSDAIRGVRRRSVVLTVFLLSLIYFSILQASFDRSSIKEDWEDVTNGRGSPHFVMTCFCAVLLFIFNRLLAAIYACTDKNGSCPMCHIPFKIFSMFIALLAIAVLLIMSAQTAGGGYIGYNCTFAEDYIEGLDDPECSTFIDIGSFFAAWMFGYFLYLAIFNPLRIVISFYISSYMAKRGLTAPRALRALGSRVSTMRRKISSERGSGRKSSAQ